MKVTVVIPTYNTPTVELNKCILSILAQTYTNFDFIIVDDGSTNAATLAYLQRIAKNYDGKQNRLIRVDFLDKNGGTSTALNHAFKINFNEWHAVVGSTDIVENIWLEKMIEYISKHPNIDALGCGLRAFTGDGANEKIMFVKQHDPIIKEAKTWYMNHGGSFVKRDSVMFLGGYWENPDHATNPNKSRAQDFDLWNRMFKAGMQLHNIPDYLYKYRK